MRENSRSGRAVADTFDWLCASILSDFSLVNLYLCKTELFISLGKKNLVFILHHTVWTVLLVSRDDSGNCCPRSWCFIIEDPVISCQSIKKSPNRPMKASEPINKSLTISLTTNPAGATASRDTSQATESWRASQLSSWARPGVRIG